MLKEVEYETLFAFKYSPRPFTKAARFEDQVSEEEKKERLDRLFKAQSEIGFRLCKKYQDKVLDILIEAIDDKTGALKGRSRENKMTYIQPKESFKKDDSDLKSLIGQTLPVHISHAFPTTLRGDML